MEGIGISSSTDQNPAQKYISQTRYKNLDRLIDDDSINLTITSPPYLNNMTMQTGPEWRTYFLGIYENWNDISKNVRDKLLISATTQVNKI